MASSSARRPEETGPADLFYNETEAKKYLHSSRMIEVQTTMAERRLGDALPARRRPSPCWMWAVGPA